MRLSSICISRRSLRSSAPSGSSSSRTAGAAPVRAQGRPAAAARPTTPAAGASRGCAAARARALPPPVASARSGDAPLLETVGDVLEHRHVREQRVVLEHGVDVPPIGRDADRVDAADQDRSLGRLLEAGEQPQRGRLAAPRRAEQRQELAPAHGEVHAIDGRDQAEALDDADQFGVDVRACRLGRH